MSHIPCSVMVFIRLISGDIVIQKFALPSQPLVNNAQKKPPRRPTTSIDPSHHTRASIFYIAPNIHTPSPIPPTSTSDPHTTHPTTMSSPTKPLASRSTNTSPTKPQPSEKPTSTLVMGNEDANKPKSMEYHRQVLQNRLAEEK